MKYCLKLIFCVILPFLYSSAIAAPCKIEQEWVPLKASYNKSWVEFFVKNGKVYPGGTEDPEPLKDVDFNSFEIIAPAKSERSCVSFWGRDKNHIYFSDTIIAEADSPTFEVVNEQIAKDKNHVYCWDFNRGGFSDEIKKIADPKTFKILLAPHDKQNSQFWYYQDTNHIFNKWCEVIKDADVKSFVMVKNPTVDLDAKDKNKTYALGHPSN